MSNDLSVFAWIRPSMKNTGAVADLTLTGMFAKYPSRFIRCSKLEWATTPSLSVEFSTTNIGLRISNLIKLLPAGSRSLDRAHFILPLNCTLDHKSEEGRQDIGVYLDQCGPSLYARIRPDEFCTFPSVLSARDPRRDPGVFTIRYVMRQSGEIDFSHQDLLANGWDNPAFVVSY